MRALRCFFWAVLYCVLYLVSASEEELVDFDFSDLKEIDWNYDGETATDDMGMSMSMGKLADRNVQSNMVAFDDYSEENDNNPFDWREKILRTALSKALTNSALRQKFVEVMPILRVLSSQQRLALSALISAQINARKGQELRLDQVRMMFGDDRKLLIPIVYDIANLVRNSARKYLQLNIDLEPASSKLQQRQQDLEDRLASNRRHIQLSSVELDDDNTGGEQFDAIERVRNRTTDGEPFGNLSDEVLDPLSINVELQATPSAMLHRPRRSAEFVHKLLRSAPLATSPLASGSDTDTDTDTDTEAEKKLNTTAFVVPPRQSSPSPSEVAPTRLPIAEPPEPQEPHEHGAMSYQEVEDLAFASLNGTEMSLDGDERDEDNSEVDEQTDSSEPQVPQASATDEPLPSPEELISGPRYRIAGNKIRSVRPSGGSKRKRIPARPRPKPTRVRAASGPIAAAASPSAVHLAKKCERFTSSMCLQTDDYPLSQIMGSIRRHKYAMGALLAEFDETASEQLDYISGNANSEQDEFRFTKKRREDETAPGGGMCQSVVRYARPQKARSASGEWKYIVNTGQHTQTLRLEKCMNPQESCSYLAHNYRSHCAQVYNYHRLLSWDKTRGLHVDIFKVPTCCSCQIDGYRQQFPPLAANIQSHASVNAKDYTPAHALDHYSTINEEDFDYADDEDELSLQFGSSNNYAQGYHHHQQEQQQQQQQHLVKGYSKYNVNVKPDVGFDVLNGNNNNNNELFAGSNKVRTKVYAPAGPTVGAYLSPPGSDEYDTKYAYKSQLDGVSSSKLGLSLHRQSLGRRRPLTHGERGTKEARVDLEIAPSETHLDKEVNLFGTTPANHKLRVLEKRKRIHSMPHTVTSTSAATATDTDTNTSTDTDTNTGAGAGAGAGTGAIAVTAATAFTRINAAHAHKTAATRPSHNAAGNIAQGHTIRPNRIDIGAAKPKLIAATITPPSASASASASVPASTSYPTASTDSAYAFGGQFGRIPPPLPPIYYVSTFYNAKYTPIAANATSPQRINYNYHPIIDFFESEQAHAHAHAHAQAEPSASKMSKSNEMASNSHVQQARERRIGYGAGISPITDNTDNSWHPVVVET